jgi:two-component system response regulator ResD
MSKRLLVVDDDLDIAETLTLVLERSGYVVATALGGAEALERLREDSVPIDLVLLDLMMPGVNGWMVRAEMARDVRLAAIPILVLTGAGAAIGEGLHVAAILHKPIKLPVLLAAIEAHLRR